MNLFDPLAEWLGIPANEQPPDHYRLLGLATFESDAGAIERAADERMALVRRHQTGRRGAATQEVLNRLAAAKQCLLDPATRSAYDAAIRGQLAARKSTAAAMRETALVEKPPAVDVDVTSVAPGWQQSAPQPARRRRLRPVVLLSFALTAATVCAGVWVLVQRGGLTSKRSPVVIVERSPSAKSAADADAPPIVRPDGGVLRCTAENVSGDDVHRRDGDLLDLTLAAGRVEVSWTVRIRKAGFYTPSVTYSAVGEGSQTFEIELPDGARRTTPIRATAGAPATDELKPVAFRKTGDHRVVLRAAGRTDRARTIELRDLQFRPIGQRAPEPSGR